jgi:hypothetical protein
MKVVLTHEESESLFFDALCNGLGYIESGYDLELAFSDLDYEDAKKKLSGQSCCYEDILMCILRNGGTLTLKDLDGDYTQTIFLQDVHERVSDTPIRHLMDAINEQGDAITADVILQSVFFREVIFG